MAAEGMISDTAELPRALHRRIPASVTVIKAHRKRSVFNRWKVLWSSFPRYARLSKIDSALPSRKLYNTLRSLPRRASSIITHLRTGHISLNAFLKKINATDSALCRHCREPETVIHSSTVKGTRSNERLSDAKPERQDDYPTRYDTFKTPNGSRTITMSLKNTENPKHIPALLLAELTL